MTMNVDPREELASARAAIRCASHAMGLACDKLNSLAHCSDAPEFQSLAERGSLALTAINVLEHDGRKLTRKVRDRAEVAEVPE